MARGPRYECAQVHRDNEPKSQVDESGLGMRLGCGRVKVVEKRGRNGAQTVVRRTPLKRREEAEAGAPGSHRSMVRRGSTVRVRQRASGAYVRPKSRKFTGPLPPGARVWAASGICLREVPEAIRKR